MSYMAGLAVGGLLAEQLYRIVGKGSHLTLAHGIVGRRRYYSSRIKLDNDYVNKVGNLLRTAKEVKSISLNRVTGSLVIKYSCSEATMDSLMDRLIENLDATPRTGRKMKRSGMLRKQIQGGFGSLNARVHRGTNGFLDLPTSCAGVLLALGLIRLIKLKEWPRGSQMLWWSYNLLKF